MTEHQRVYSKLLGSEVDSWSEDWRHECECSSILAMPTRDARHDFLLGVEKFRGRPSAEKLKSDVLRLWEINRVNK